MPQPTQDQFFLQMHDWSDRKLRLLQNYVDSAARILGKVNSIYYVDGFAGRGTYADGSLGSPIRIAELAQQFAKEGKPYSFQCINVEEHDSNYANLAAQTAKYGKLVRNFHGRFADHLDTILQIIGTQPAIFFLDPFGLKGIEWSAVKKIIARRPPSDLWIRFDHTDVRRLDGNFEVNESKFQILSAVFGIPDTAQLHMRLDSGETPSDRIQACLDLYRDQLKQAFKQAKRSGYADAYTIRSLEGDYKYHLMFATAHAKGIILASNTVYSVEEEYMREVQEYREAREQNVATQLSLFPEAPPTQEEIFQDKAIRLKADIWRMFQGKTLSRLEIHAAILDTWFGIIKAKHITAALNILKDEGCILEMSAGTISQDKTLFTFKAS